VKVDGTDAVYYV